MSFGRWTGTWSGKNAFRLMPTDEELPAQQDPLDQIAYLDQQRDAGKITDAEFEAQKRKLLG